MENLNLINDANIKYSDKAKDLKKALKENEKLLSKKEKDIRTNNINIRTNNRKIEQKKNSEEIKNNLKQLNALYIKENSRIEKEINKIKKEISKIKKSYGVNYGKIERQLEIVNDIDESKLNKSEIRNINKLKKNIITSKNKALRIRRVDEDALNYFKKRRIDFDNVYENPLEGLYYRIVEEVQELQKTYLVEYISLFLVNEYKNKVRGVSIGVEYLSSYEKFLNRIEDIKNKGETGSGNYFNSNLDLEEEIQTDVFTIIYYVKPKGMGDPSKLLFECEKFSDGNCGYESLKKCGFEYKGNKKDLYTLDKMIKVIKENKLPINIMANVFNVLNSVEITKREGVEIQTKDKKGRDANLTVWKVENSDIYPIYIYKCSLEYDEFDTKIYDGQIYTIVFDEINKHFDVIKDNIRLVDNVYIDFANQIYINNNLIFTTKQIISNSKDNHKDAELEYVFFDYETIIDFELSNCMKEYSLSILNLTISELNQLEKADNENDNKTINKIRKNKCKTFIGYNCSEKFIDWIIENQKNKIFCFVGFNNTNFDNFIFLNSLLKDSNNPNGRYSVSNIFYNGSQLLNFVMNGRHHTFDIHKHLMGSLRNNCESFKIKCCKKLEFDHSKAQELYLDGGLIEYIKNNNELKDYNEYDVLATAVLFRKYQLALENIPATKKYSNKLNETKTIGSLIYKVFEEHQTTNNIKLPKIKYEYYNDLQKSKIAGRVELFNGAQEIKERLASTDVCSLYPFVMSILDVYYPCGDKIEEVKEYKGDNVLGFYYCDIDQSNLRKNNLPNIYAEKLELENDWASKNELKNYLISNVMIGLLKKYGCKVVIKNGFIFTDKLKSCEMFKFLLDFMKEKNQQDTYKKNKDEKYNPALRETEKLLMNSLSGKVIEGLHTEKTEAVNSISEFEKIKENSKVVNVINKIGDKVFITYEVNEKDICDKQQRPIYLGVLIYDYAKRYMYENSYSKIGLNKLLYTDTDASKFRYRDFINWKKWVDDNNVQVPHWKEVEDYDERYKNHKIYSDNSKVFGSFEDELEDMVGDDYIFYCIEKKSWLYSYNKNNKWNSKFKFKGINGSARLLSLQEDFIGSKIVKHKAKDDIEAWDETVYFIKPNMDIDVYNYYTKNDEKAIENGNEISFYKQIFETGEGYVLTQSFRKIVKNTKRNVNIDDDKKFNDLINSIQVNINIKHINIKK
jgi:hypothetical protein